QQPLPCTLWRTHQKNEGNEREHIPNRTELKRREVHQRDLHRHEVQTPYHHDSKRGKDVCSTQGRRRRGYIGVQNACSHVINCPPLKPNVASIVIRLLFRLL